MARKIYRIDEFFGIDQSRDENSLPVSMSPDACNMDTSGGGLRVASGYEKHILQPVPGTGKIHGMRLLRLAGGDRLVVAAGNELFAWNGQAWRSVYTYSAITGGRFDFLQVKVGSTEYLLAANGEGQMVKFDGETATLFGSAEGVSNLPVNYLAMYKSRLFAAGDPNYPNRLYWSQLPGGTRSIEDWSQVEDSANVEGGHAEVGGTAGDPIVGLKALSNQLLIFKRSSLFRLIGDKPGSFVIEELDAALLPTANAAVVKVADALFFMTPGGMFGFNGVSASLMQDANCVEGLLKSASLEGCRGAYAGNKLYFTLVAGGEDAMLEYDLMRGAYMLRRGFSVRDIAAWDGELYLVGDGRYIYHFGKGSSYDGMPINAWWSTPRTDAHDKGSVKALRELYLSGSSEGDAALLVDVHLDGEHSTHRLLLPESGVEVAELPLKNEGRSFKLRFFNESGGRFELRGGIELMFETWRRAE